SKIPSSSNVPRGRISIVTLGDTADMDESEHLVSVIEFIERAISAVDGIEVVIVVSANSRRLTLDISENDAGNLIGHWLQYGGYLVVHSTKRILWWRKRVYQRMYVDSIDIEDGDFRSRVIDKVREVYKKDASKAVPIR